MKDNNIENLPLYVPNGRVCHMMQYHCCTQRPHCRLYPICSQMDSATSHSVCIMDCPNCKYEGCSLSEKDRKDNPLYVDHICQQENQTMDYDLIRFREKQKYRKQHDALYCFYNRLFGDLREKKRVRAREWRRQNRQVSKSENKQSSKRASSYIPDCCDKDCFNCKYEDCLLPENWLKRAYQKKYYDTHREAELARVKAYHESHPVETQEYQKKYYETHKEETKSKVRRWREANPEKYQAQTKRNNQKRQERRNGKSKGDVGNRNFQTESI